MKLERIVLAGLVLAIIVGNWIGCNRSSKDGTDLKGLVELSKRGETPAQAPVIQLVQLDKKDVDKIKADLAELKENCIGKCPEPEPVKVPPIPESWPDMDGAPLMAMSRILAEELESTWGWRADDLVIGRLFDNGASRQKGEAQAIKAYARVFTGRARPGNAGPVKALNESMVKGDLEKLWFPSGKKTALLGLSALDDLAIALDKKEKINLPADPKTLNAAVKATVDILEREIKAVTDPEIGTMKDDNALHHARGVALVSEAVLSSMAKPFDKAVKKAGAAKDLKTAVSHLKVAGQIDPLTVLGGDEEELSSNHLLLMAYELDQASDALKNIK